VSDLLLTAVALSLFACRDTHVIFVADAEQFVITACDLCHLLSNGAAVVHIPFLESRYEINLLIREESFPDPVTNGVDVMSVPDEAVVLDPL
jgi:hypothetical protein